MTRLISVASCVQCPVSSVYERLKGPASRAKLNFMLYAGGPYAYNK